MVYICMVSKNRNRKTRTEALSVDVADRLHAIRVELAKRGNGWGTSRLPSYSEAVRYLLDKEGF